MTDRNFIHIFLGVSFLGPKKLSLANPIACHILLGLVRGRQNGQSSWCKMTGTSKSKSESCFVTLYLPSRSPGDVRGGGRGQPAAHAAAAVAARRPAAVVHGCHEGVAGGRPRQVAASGGRGSLHAFRMFELSGLDLLPYTCTIETGYKAAG